jgi:hypothetical protein
MIETYLEEEDALAVHFVILELAFVLVAIGKKQNALEERGLFSRRIQAKLRLSSR